MVLPRDCPSPAEPAKALGQRTSLAVGGTPAQTFAPGSAVEAARLVRWLRHTGMRWRVLGGGFNLLADDGPLDGAVIATHRLKGWTVRPDRVTVGAGESFPSLVRRSIAWGLPGVPGCPGIPGQVGGVVAMNAGGRHGCVADALHAVDWVAPDGTRIHRVVRPGDLGYRRSRFQGGIVTAATFRRDPGLSTAAAQALFDEALAWKKATQPLGARSAGCIFKNPPGTRSAGALIDAAGLKGHRIGGARISPRHANFIENVEAATAADVHALIRDVQARVAAHAGVELELEVQVWNDRVDVPS